MIRVTALFILGVILGAGVAGVAVSVMLILQAPLFDATTAVFGWYAVATGSAVGAVVATVAGLGSITGLLFLIIGECGRRSLVRCWLASARQGWWVPLGRSSSWLPISPRAGKTLPESFHSSWR